MIIDMQMNSPHSTEERLTKVSGKFGSTVAWKYSHISNFSRNRSKLDYYIFICLSKRHGLIAFLVQDPNRQLRQHIMSGHESAQCVSEKMNFQWIHNWLWCGPQHTWRLIFWGVGVDAGWWFVTAAEASMPSRSHTHTLRKARLLCVMTCLCETEPQRVTITCLPAGCQLCTTSCNTLCAHTPRVTTRRVCCAYQYSCVVEFLPPSLRCHTNTCVPLQCNTTPSCGTIRGISHHKRASWIQPLLSFHRGCHHILCPPQRGDVIFPCILGNGNESISGKLMLVGLVSCVRQWPVNELLNCIWLHRSDKQTHTSVFSLHLKQVSNWSLCIQWAQP